MNIVAGLSTVSFWKYGLAVIGGKMVMIFTISFIGYDIPALIHQPIRTVIVFIIIFILWYVGKRIERNLDQKLNKKKDSIEDIIKKEQGHSIGAGKSNDHFSLKIYERMIGFSSDLRYTER